MAEVLAQSRAHERLQIRGAGAWPPLRICMRSCSRAWASTSATASLGTHVRALVKPFELEDLESLLNEIDTALKMSNAA